ncbi:hypothetical protein VU10_04075 [Desulfobulbus sp. US1]|nr:hypothetical protein [Desulfobulbus sp. US1]
MSDHATNEEPEHGIFLWNILLAKDVDISSLSGEIFLKGHNIFNGDQYIDFEYPNPERWLETGLTVKF